MMAFNFNQLLLGQGVFSQYFNFAEIEWEGIWESTLETLYMTLGSMIAVFILGIFIGLLLFLTSGNDSWPVRMLNIVVSIFVNIFRSIPFIILIVLLIPYTQIIVGTMTGPSAALPALIISSAPFYGRLVETGFRDVDKGVIEAAESMGASQWQIIYKVLLPESSPSIFAGLTTTSIAVVGYTAMAGVIGAGGLGNLAYLRGFQRNEPTVTLVATVIILIIVFIIQGLGDLTVKSLDKR